MIARLPARALTPRPSIERLIAHYGATAVLWATLRALMMPRKKRPRPPDPYALSPHMRRDIGLPPAEPHVPKYYELR
ncbi:hypothetical protein [Paracoccus homiensis]|uniref:DUF1127 domain-containing protein n=1 Tax=Paracoccus homiensis TaxID=364199 RepID=A0A1I0EGJ1_9RHOB|nr:hypothetical protein [Paracoccus homiensis]SET44430.1 hypothetical protein SAMN04489858_105147 [Paracoccus homiensis]